MIIRNYIGVLLFYTVSSQVRPRNFSPDALPETSFTCEDKVSGSYYADVEADCQLFHVCVQVSEYEFQDFHFLCPNDTVFDQQHLVCTNWFDVDCQQSLQFFPHDFAFDIGDEYDLVEYEDQAEQEQNNQQQNRFLGDSQSSLSSGLLSDGRGLQSSGPVVDYVYEYEEDEDISGRRPVPAVVSTTPIPVGITTTRRSFDATPRVKSNILQRQKNKGVRVRPSLPPDQFPVGEQQEEELDINNDIFTNPFENPPFISADGKQPRVKSNINNRLIQSGKSVNKAKKQGSKKVELDRSQLDRIEFVEPTTTVRTDEVPDVPFLGPDVIPDGRAPRVKANILAKARDKGKDKVRLGQQQAVSPARRPAFFRPSAEAEVNNLSNAIQDDLPSRFPSKFNFPDPRPTSPPAPSPTPPPPPQTSPPRPFKSPSFDLGPPPQPKIPQFLLDRLPPPANRPPVTRPAPSFSFSPPSTPSSLFVPPPDVPEQQTARRPVGQQQQAGQPAGPTPQPIFTSSSFNPFDLTTPRPPSSPSFDLPTEALNPQPTIRTTLIRDRNRFGTRPRVKSNEQARNRNRNRLNEKSRSQSVGQSINSLPGAGKASRRPTQQPATNIRFVPPTPQNELPTNRDCLNPFKCPPKTFAGGRRPRVKSNIKARKRNFWNPRKSRFIQRRRKPVKLNPILRANIRGLRQGRKQNLGEEDRNAINTEEKRKGSPTTTALPTESTPSTVNPILSLQQIVKDKERSSFVESTTFSTLARRFQNKRLPSKKNFRNFRNRFPAQRFNGRNPAKTRTTPLTTTTRSTSLKQVVDTTPASIFVTFPATPDSPTTPPRTTTTTSTTVTPPIVTTTVSHSRVTVFTETSFSHPVSESTRFTIPDDAHLFVTNPRALPPDHPQHEHPHQNQIHNPFSHPPTKSQDGRSPRVKSNIAAKHQKKFGNGGDTPWNPVDLPAADKENTKPVLKINPDGRAPRVKSNLMRKGKRFGKKFSEDAEHTGGGQRTNGRLGGGQRTNSRLGAGRSLDFEDNDNFIEDVSSKDEDYDYMEPEVRPDGRQPRVKSNIRANKAFSPRGLRPSGRRFGKKKLKPDQRKQTETVRTTEESVTTFRPSVNLNTLLILNEPGNLSVPLPNIQETKAELQENNVEGRFADFRPTPRAFTSREPAFSDFPNGVASPLKPSKNMKPGKESVTEIVKVFLSDKRLFEDELELDYYDYYDDRRRI